MISSLISMKCWFFFSQNLKFSSICLFDKILLVFFSHLYCLFWEQTLVSFLYNYGFITLKESNWQGKDSGEISKKKRMLNCDVETFHTSCSSFLFLFSFTSFPSFVLKGDMMTTTTATATKAKKWQTKERKRVYDVED